MICVRLEGGLGNQLFQYAAGRAVAQRLGAELIWDCQTLATTRRGVTARSVELERFSVHGRAAHAREVCAMRLLVRTGRAARLLTRWRVRREVPDRFDPGFAHFGDGSYLAGYWQSPRYFDDIRHLLTQELAPRLDLSPQSRECAASIAATESIAVHIRRGDYVNLPAAAGFHGTLPLAYYGRALERLAVAVPHAQLVVFSDDPEWCRQHLPPMGRTLRIVSHNGGPDAWQDLILMSRCHHHVIANSSFSWWGAWLADQHSHNPARQVLAPLRWFAGRDIDPAVRFPATWQVLS